MMLILSSFIAFLSLVFTVWKLGPHWVKRLFGYDYVVDVFLGLFLTVIFGMTATITGVLIATMTNFMVGVGLWIGKNTYGYQKCEFTGWTRKQFRIPRTSIHITYWKYPTFSWVEYEGQWIVDFRGTRIGRLLCGK